jgi:hypothetical protein
MTENNNNNISKKQQEALDAIDQYGFISIREGLNCYAGPKYHIYISGVTKHELAFDGRAVNALIKKGLVKEISEKVGIDFRFRIVRA